jgi:hypothetical protein
MVYNVKTTDVFERQSLRLIKKFPSLKAELLELVVDLKTNPQQGTPLGNSCYKIRLAIASKGKGKSGGGRIIANVVVSQANVYLLSVYDKSEKENLDPGELKRLLSQVPR